MGHERLETYLNRAGAQIRWRRARKVLLRELSDHIDDQATALRAAGVPEEEALNRAVAEMGDPVEVGKELDRLHRPQNRWELLLFLAALLAAGLAAQQVLLQGALDGRSALLRQMAGVAAGCGLFLVAWLSDCTALLRRRWRAVLCLAVLTAVSLLSLRFLPMAHGRSIPPLPLYLSLLLPPAYALALSRLRGRGWLTVLLCALGTMVLPLPALMAPSLSSALIAWAAMLLVLGTAVLLGWFSCKRSAGLICAWGIPGILAAVGLAAFLRSERWRYFLRPELDPQGKGWLYLLLRQGGEPLPCGSSSDFMLSSLSFQEGLGRWVFPLTALLFAVFAALVLRRVLGLRSVSGKLAALGAFWPLALQAALFVAYNLGWSPLAPLSLPFLSYGVGYMAVNLLLAGVLLSVLRMDALTRDGTAGRSPGPNHLLLSLFGGKLQIICQSTPPASSSTINAE